MTALGGPDVPLENKMAAVSFSGSKPKIVTGGQGVALAGLPARWPNDVQPGWASCEIIAYKVVAYPFL